MELFEKYADLVLLAYFLKNPSGRFYVKELARALKLSPSCVSITSRKFELDGILSSEKSGLAKFYALNNEAPLTKAFKVLYTIARLHDAELVKRFLEADGSVISIAIYGSYASGAYDEHSDLNILVLSQKEKEVFAKPLGELGAQLGLRIMLEVFKLGRWRELARAGDPLYREVLSNHILLFGSSLA